MTVTHVHSTESGADGPPTIDEIREFTARLAFVHDYDSARADIDAITVLESLTAVAAAAQASITDHAGTCIRTDRRERGLPKAQWGSGIATQIGLARRESPRRGSTFLGLARALVHEMPHTHALMRRGLLNEYRAILLTRETAHLTAEDRATVDRELCSDPATLAGRGDKTIVAMAAAIAVRLDAEAVVRRAARAREQRRVSVRPAPEFMSHLTVLLPMDQGVRVYATLRRDADSLIATGGADGRTRDQIMTDLLIERVTGTSAATATPVAVQAIISDAALVGGDGDSYVPGYGTVPAALARHLIDCAHRDPDSVATLRRFYSSPTTGHLTAMESVARIFPEGLAHFLDVRDRTCRTPWCDAPIRHHDHIEPHAHGGSTTADNGMGLCASCNFAKEADGWSATRLDADVHLVDVETPTGHTYESTPPLPTAPITLPAADDLLRREAG